MARSTSSFSLQVPTLLLGGPIKIFDKNPYRLLYSIQNLDANNYIAIGKVGVTAGIFGSLEGQHLAAGQPMSDDTDQDEVWAIADTGVVNIAIVEISESPAGTKEHNPKVSELRGRQPRELREETRTF